MERVDGTQARLKLRKILQDYGIKPGGKGGWDSGEIETHRYFAVAIHRPRGKGGWDSGEIETFIFTSLCARCYNVERVDGTQARLKPSGGIPFLSNLCVERVDGTQARLKPLIVRCRHHIYVVERVDGTQARLKLLEAESTDLSKVLWKGWMGLRRD